MHMFLRDREKKGGRKERERERERREREERERDEMRERERERERSTVNERYTEIEVNEIEESVYACV